MTSVLGALHVETQKDYLVLSDFTAGLTPETQVQRMAEFALDLENAARVALREPSGKRNKQIKFRIVLATGPVVYAVVGRLLPKFCAFGPTVNNTTMTILLHRDVRR